MKNKIWQNFNKKSETSDFRFNSLINLILLLYKMVVAGLKSHYLSQLCFYMTAILELGRKLGHLIDFFFLILKMSTSMKRCL